MVVICDEYNPSLLPIEIGMATIHIFGKGVYEFYGMDDLKRNDDPERKTRKSLRYNMV